jgi:hypothetical protein
VVLRGSRRDTRPKSNQAMSNPCCGRERLDKDAPCMPLRRITALQDARVHFINDSPMMCILRDSLTVSLSLPPRLQSTKGTSCPARRSFPPALPQRGRCCVYSFPLAMMIISRFCGVAIGKETRRACWCFVCSDHGSRPVLTGRALRGYACAGHKEWQFHYQRCQRYNPLPGKCFWSDPAFAGVHVGGRLGGSRPKSTAPRCGFHCNQT